MKKIMLFSMTITLSACTGSNAQTGRNTQQETCICDKAIERDSVVFATNVTIKDHGKKHFFEFTLEGRKVKSILKLDIE